MRTDALGCLLHRPAASSIALRYRLHLIHGQSARTWSRFSTKHGWNHCDQEQKGTKATRCWLVTDIFEVMPCLLVRPELRNVVLKVIPWWSIMCREQAGRRKPRPFEEKSMSREDDFDDIMDSDVTDSAQDDTSEPLLEDESGDGSTPEETEAVAPI